ncbi:MAG: efflux RND transporter permease subunit [Bdellovibrionaceae bacterium]|nr:efflux RND transporter permease subunit [Pseudobdellovibrionaceae bacterium]
MKFFISNTRLVILICLCFVIMGTRGLLNLKRESIPPVDFARATITTIYPGSSSTEVDELITTKIEEEIRLVDHLKDVNSTSQPGLSQIVIRIDIDKTDSEKVINELNQALQNVQGLPQEVLNPPRLFHINANTDKSIVFLHLTGPDNNRKRDEIAWDLKTKLEGLRTVPEIRVGNYKKREFLVLLSQEKMDKHHISSADVILALNQKKYDFPAGYLENNTNRSLVRVLNKPRTVKELENTIIRSNFSGQKISIKDIAKVIDGTEKENEKEYFYSSKASENYKLKPVTSLEVLKTAEADTLKTISKVKKQVNEFKKTLQNSYKIIAGFNEGDNIKRRLMSVINNALTGLILIFIVFFLFLPSRVGLMASLSLPLSILGTFSILPYLGVSFNVITMLAFVICIGMLVDNSVVISEYYSRLLTKHNHNPREASLSAVTKFVKPITATVLTTIVAFLPMLVTTGVMGEFIKWIPLVITLALLISLFESFFLLPNRLQWLSQNKPSSYQKTLLKKIDQIENSFEIFIKKATQKKYISLAGILILIFGTGILFKFGSKIDLFSSRNPEFYTARLKAKPNSSLEQMNQITNKIIPQIQEVFQDDLNWISAKVSPKQTRVLLQVKKQSIKKLNYKNTIEKLRQIDKEDLEELRFNKMGGGPPVGKALNIAIQSNDRKEIRKFIEEVFPDIEKIEGLVGLTSDPNSDMGYEYKVETDIETLARLGLDIQAVGLALRTALEGTLITELTENNESFYIRVKHKESELSDLETLKQIKIKERFGRLVSLSEVAQIKKVPAEAYKKSYNFLPVVFLSSDIDPKKTTSLKVNDKAKKIIQEKIKKYPSLSFKLIGEQETTEESLRSLFNAALLALFAIFIILIVMFKSFLLSFLILSCIPLGLIGVIWSFFLHGRSLNFFAMVGVVGLAGVVVNSAIILINFILTLKKEKPNESYIDIVAQASKLRFRPIMITNLTTMGGLLPTAYGLAGFEPLLMPMTLALFWGLLTATLLTLIWVPCFYLAIEDSKNWVKKWFKKLIRLNKHSI